MSKIPLIISAFALAFASCSNSSSTTFKSSFAAPKLPPPGGFPNIFKSYSATGNATMMEGWARDFDMSGVSFDQKMTATLVTRRHVVMAMHYRRNPGSKVIFHTRNGERVERTLTKIQRVYSDVAVGSLNLDVPPSLKVYPIPLPNEDYSRLKGQTAVVTDQNRRIFFHEIAAVRPHVINFRHHRPNLHGWGKNLISGDSGNPSFLISGGQLVLIETHTSGGGGAGPFYGSPELQKRLQEEISNLTPGYRFKTKSL